jgi:hypothetical protein
MQRNFSILGSIFLFGVFCGIPVFASANPVSPSPELEAAMLYRGGCATALAVKSPSHSLPFFLLVDDKGTGHFVDYTGSGLSHKLSADGTPENCKSEWKPTLKQTHSWNSLTKGQAQAVWGEPHFVFDRTGISTFDAYGSYIGEKNLYHLDLVFEDGKILSRYRVRGIGIVRPQWIGISSDGNEIMNDELYPEVRNN